MAEAVVYHRGAAKRKINRDIRNSARKGNRLLVILVLMLFFLLVLEVIGQLYILPNLLVRHVEITADFDIPRDRIVSIAELDKSMYFFNVNTSIIKSRIMEYPLVKDVTVRKYFPDKLKITIIGRRPIASSLAEINGKSIPVLVDENGVIFKLGASVDTFDIPVISGLVFKDLKLGMSLPARILPLLKDLYELKRNNPELYGVISEIKVEPVNRTDYELVLFPVSYNIRVRLGNRIDGKTVKYALVILDLIKNEMHADNIEEVDLRNDTMVYKVRREQ